MDGIIRSHKLGRLNMFDHSIQKQTNKHFYLGYGTVRSIFGVYGNVYILPILKK